MRKKKTVKTGGQIIYIPSSLLLSNPYRARIYFSAEALNELAESISHNGILEPLTVRAAKSGGYQIISGERRFRAAVACGLERLPCVLINANDEKCALMSITQNMQKKELNFFEEACALDKLSTSFALTLEQVSHMTGKSRLYIMNKQRLLGISPAMRKKIIENGLTEKHTIVLLKLQNEVQREKLLEQVIKQRLTVSKTTEAAAAMLKPPEKPKITVCYFKSIDVFTNTIEHAVDTMHKSGINAVSEKNESETDVEYRISIPKAT